MLKNISWSLNSNFSYLIGEIDTKEYEYFHIINF